MDIEELVTTCEQLRDRTGAVTVNVETRGQVRRAGTSELCWRLPTLLCRRTTCRRTDRLPSQRTSPTYSRR